MNNRYEEIKRFYKDYIILIKQKDKYVTLKEDKDILLYIKYKNKFSLKEKHLNYLVLNNLDIEEIYKAENNEYDIYYLKSMLSKIVSYIGGR